MVFAVNSLAKGRNYYINRDYLADFAGSNQYKSNGSTSSDQRTFFDSFDA